MYYIYILKSEKDESYYVGFAEDVQKRLQRHNSGGARYTKNRGPWKLVYTEEYSDRGSAMSREKEIKSWKSRKCIEELLN